TEVAPVGSRTETAQQPARLRAPAVHCTRFPAGMPIGPDASAGVRTTVRRRSAHPTRWPMNQVAAAIAAAPGNVNTHARTMLTATFQLTADSRRVAPTPMMAAEMACVVEIGAPSPIDAPYSTPAPTVSAAKPCGGSSMTILLPMVRMILIPPVAVPIDSTPAQDRNTQSGIDGPECTPATLSASTTMPIVLAASCMP